MPSPFDLTGNVALVTGSGAGIGLELARGLGQAGATLVLNGRDTARLERARVALAADLGVEVFAAAFDVTDEPGTDAAVGRIESEVGPVDILVNNAGVQHRQPLAEVSLHDWSRVLDTNLTGPFLVGRQVAARMVGRGRGKVVNVCSIQSELARPSIGAYTAAKGGLRNLTRAMAAEWAPYGVQVNGLAPGYIHTEMTQPLVDDADFNAWVLRRTPAGRWGTPGDLAGTAVWLASAASDFVNGQVIYVDGGMTAVV